MCQRRLKSVLAAVPRLGHELCSQLAQAQPHLSPALQRLYVEVTSDRLRVPLHAGLHVRHHPSPRLFPM